MKKYTILVFLIILVSIPAHAGQQNGLVSIHKPDNIDKGVAAYGKELFNDTRFSKDNNISCNSCHDLNNYGVSKNQAPNTLNTPTVYNAALNWRHFSDGSAKSLYEVIDYHVKDEKVFANNWDNILKSFSVTNKEELTEPLVTFLETLITPSAFDRYLDGDRLAISDDAIDGYEVFIENGCNLCHQGKNIGGNMFHKMGIYKPYFAAKNDLIAADYGRFNVTKNNDDKFVYKVPSLRNVAKTPPYFHDSSEADLKTALIVMGEPKIGRSIPRHKIPKLLAFLQSLTGEDIGN